MKTLLVALALATVAACQFDWPDSSRRDSLGPETTRRGPLHRPGQPCLWCHDNFVLAGTAYRFEADAKGVQNASIAFTDANGTVKRVTSNSAGNFYISDSSGAGMAFPLHVTVTLGGTERVMRSAIEREGNCAVCHLEPPGATTVGKVFVEDPR